MLANELNEYKGQENHYVNENIREIQDIYRDEEQKRLEERKEKDKEIILIKLYEVSTTTSRTTSFKTTESSFIYNKIKNHLHIINYFSLEENKIQNSGKK